MLALGRLDGVRAIAPDTSLFLYMYVRKEALLSSQIEGTQSSLSDLLLYENDEAPGAPIDDVEEVSTYVAALNHGLQRMTGGFPLSTRLIREMHGILLATGRGSTKQPGEFRSSQNWIGGTRPGNALFVPPPPSDVPDLMSDLERFLHEPTSGLPAIVKAGLAHVQFETIHPFLDGNGRLGRLLITLYLCTEGILQEPLLYVSLYLKANRATYYDLLQEVRTEGRWEVWLEFFLKGVRDVASQAHDAAREISRLFADDLEKTKSLGRAAPTADLVHLQGRRSFRDDLPDGGERPRQFGIARDRQGNQWQAARTHLRLSGLSRHPERRRRAVAALTAFLGVLSTSRFLPIC